MDHWLHVNPAGVYIFNTLKHFIIQNNFVELSTPFFAKTSACFCDQFPVGISIFNSKNGKVINNTIYHAYKQGIRLETLENFEIIDNIIYKPNLHEGLYINNVKNAIIRNNQINGSHWSGINLDFKNINISITDNLIADNAIGLRIYQSNLTLVNNNSFVNNINNAIELVSSTNNKLYFNNFLNNNNNKSQVSDDSYNNFWYVDKIGNYWSDHSSLDSNGDGKGDSSYEINANLSVYDKYPLINNIFDDSDGDGLLNEEELSIGTDLNNPDSDGDGLPDKFESVNNAFNPLDPIEEFLDFDGDGMTNSWEYSMGLNPLLDDADEDLDNDAMSNLFEFRLGLDASDASDGQGDLDLDELPNSWEFLMGLKPLTNDADEDLDEDGLTNLQEFEFGSWANMTDSDLDLIPDLYEFQMGLNPMLDDAELDKDTDGMTNLWEYQNNLLANDPSDALTDNDGDWISNLDEFKSRTNPRDLLSVPLLSFSLIHAFLLISVILAIILIYGFIYINNNKKKKLIEKLNTPDYSTALKIVQAGLETYEDYQNQNMKGNKSILLGRQLYLEGDSYDSLLKFNESMSIFTQLENNEKILEVIANIVYLNYESGKFKSDDPIINQFNHQKKLLQQESEYSNIIEALLAELDKNWGVAGENWNVVSNSNLPAYYKLVALEQLIELEFYSFTNNPDKVLLTNIKNKIEHLIDNATDNEEWNFVSYGRILLAKVYFFNVNFDNAEKEIEKSLEISKSKNFILLIDLAEKEKDLYNKYKQNILDKELDPKKSQEKFDEYVNQAIDYLKEA
ncbi:MAG: hypothetical protein HeimC3_31640 [Candidatus Heimdallarchaeota archaeon LC_3]|nr:MAG: hypothetical protein HeimC3_31640 [Candidatus Heimdallarchaeota archaeon LC_3]